MERQQHKGMAAAYIYDAGYLSKLTYNWVCSSASKRGEFDLNAKEDMDLRRGKKWVRWRASGAFTAPESFPGPDQSRHERTHLQ
jgi:hypothetical protein